MEGFWDNTERARELSQERSSIEATLKNYSRLETLAGDSEAALELVGEGSDQEFVTEAKRSLTELEQQLGELEFKCKMRGEFDRGNAILEINGGSGGTEAQDWAQMLLRMYIRWAERHSFALEELDYQSGEVAGIKNAALLIQGEFAYGFLRGEQGVHRLVRISPFDSNARRHTSFASITVTPDIDQEIDIKIEDKDLRVDTYRSSGAGGQHVNKTDSAIRLTHLPTGIVVACQNERSQHRNRDRAMKILKAKLYELERLSQADKLDQIKGPRMKIDFGSQIRSYVLQPYQLIKDLRTDHETSSVNAVLDGAIDEFIEAYLLSDLNV